MVEDEEGKMKEYETDVSGSLYAEEEQGEGKKHIMNPKIDVRHFGHTLV